MLPSACSDDSALLTMIFLASLHDVLDDEEAFAIHSEQVNNTVRLKGGVHALQADIGIKAAVYQLVECSQVANQTNRTGFNGGAHQSMMFLREAPNQRIYPYRCLKSFSSPSPAFPKVSTTLPKQVSCL